MAIMYQVVIDTNVLVAALRFEAWLFVPAPGSGGRSTLGRRICRLRWRSRAERAG
jgi:hypothetical protein